MNFHRQTDDVLDMEDGRSTEPWLTLPNLLSAFLFVAFVIGMLAWAQHNDEIAFQEDAAQRRTHTAQREVPGRLVAAYEQGMSDALAAVQDTPSGLALAQACMAKRSAVQR